MLVAPAALQAQTTGGSAPRRAPAGATAKITPADSAACARVIGYAFQHPEVIEKSEKLRASGQTDAIKALPDSVRARIAAAVVKGQSDSLKALARRTLPPEKGSSFDEMIDFVTALPDSVRTAVATLMASGRPMTCS
jgi:hypothetical protein